MNTAKLLNKLLRNPLKFFADVVHNRIPLSKKMYSKETIFVFHINEWKRDFFERIYHNKKLVYIPFGTKNKVLKKKYLPFFNKNKSNILVWGMNAPEFILNSKANVTYVEDGFIRSIGLGSEHVEPMSLCFDSQTAYFNAMKPSDLEDILNDYDFSSDLELMKRAKILKEAILKTGISKYNHNAKVDIRKIYGKKNRKRILVLGQVEDDASIKFGSNKQYTNNDLVKIAVKENPNAHVIYKPHPDVLHKKRENLSDPTEVSNICDVLEHDIPLSQSFETIDHVYTITSQGGFEALLRGIKVTTLGCPFYSGWGLTDSRQPNCRRKAVRTVDEVLAGSYILYPKYFDGNQQVEIEDVIKKLLIQKHSLGL